MYKMLVCVIVVGALLPTSSGLNINGGKSLFTNKQCPGTSEVERIRDQCVDEYNQIDGTKKLDESVLCKIIMDLFDNLDGGDEYINEMVMEYASYFFCLIEGFGLLDSEGELDASMAAGVLKTLASWANPEVMTCMSTACTTLGKANIDLKDEKQAASIVLAFLIKSFDECCSSNMFGDCKTKN